MSIEINNALIEEILSLWKDRIGGDFAGYRGHVYRMFNFCLALHPCSEDEKKDWPLPRVFMTSVFGQPIPLITSNLRCPQ